MGSNNSPLESLAAFAIVFVLGILSTASLGKYVQKIKSDTQYTVRRNDERNIAP